jgi:60 kDa SS-A/Ro ribonucleoprotein
MANSTLFASLRGLMPAPAAASNEAGGLAYAKSPELALAVYAATGCLNGTFYASDETQLAQVLALAAQVEPGLVARTAIHARKAAYMKDMPALLLASLSVRDGGVLARAFPQVVDNGRLLRNFVQVMRSGRIARKSLGTLPRRLVRAWLEAASDMGIVQAAIGNQPSLADVIRMVHPKPANASREALYAWVVGRPYSEAALPATLQAYEAFKREPGGDLPDLPFQYYTALPLTAVHWRELALRASWQTLRMNLNTFARNGVFKDAEVTAVLAARLRDPALIQRARVFPYQLLMAANAARGLPEPIVEALHQAMEVATRQVPVLAGKVVVAVDVSGSMRSPVSGVRKGGTSKAQCVDVAALVAACIRRNNPEARVLPFDTAVREVRLEASEGVIAQARRLAALCGGGTAISAPLAQLNREKAAVDLLVIVSDNESWADTRSGGPTETMRQWAAIKARCPGARLVCIDLQPVATGQAQEREDVLHVGGFSDAVFSVVAGFAAPQAGGSWLERIAAVDL